MAELKDSGERREFESGAVRDISEGKGRCDLLPLGIIGELTADPILIEIERFIYTKRPTCLETAIGLFVVKNNWSMPDAILEVSIQYEDGVRKYGERNWEKGMPLHCFIDSGVRHYIKWCREDTDEPHDRAFLWNIFNALWTLKNRPDLDDINVPKSPSLSMVDSALDQIQALQPNPTL